MANLFEDNLPTSTDKSEAVTRHIDAGSLFKNVHFVVPKLNHCIYSVTVKGDYDFYHYLCDEIDDRGWGCGYRAAQTIFSWIREKKLSEGQLNVPEVPSIRNIQEILVKIGHKFEKFIASEEWIGVAEISMLLDQIYEIPCRILHFPSLNQIINKQKILEDHFKTIASPLLISGDKNSCLKLALGYAQVMGERVPSLLIADTHCMSQSDAEKLPEKGWVKWFSIKDLPYSSFYNISFPLYNKFDQSCGNMNLSTENTTEPLLESVHCVVPPPKNCRFLRLIRGDYYYYHCLCDGIDDRNWGSGYRCAQIICSWIRQKRINEDFNDVPKVPTIREMQKILVENGNKAVKFINSNVPIMISETAIVFNHIYELSSRILNFRSLNDIANKHFLFQEHFKNIASPLMISGETDSVNNVIIGCAQVKGEHMPQFLVVDPHCISYIKYPEQLIQKGWIKWIYIKDMPYSDSYSINFPLYKSE